MSITSLDKGLTDKKDGYNDVTEYLQGVKATRQMITDAHTNGVITKADKEDIKFGWDVAKELGRLDVGQCVVVKRKTVLALEATDGTN